ncbi:conserved hypothetical protein [Aspergillus terreus NIH2624]|uniref:Protein phosphatase n=1 Tax=Aspergillus terreus (strain NIH 2624 / FGSC A1156) TaxID=341663 RepID=Q0D1V2_ASPTN|nr:uncharacterized protein ATEG_00082 [Aspergillus terreus NIH2624]EAU38728.1 conserved hypothetical protein [Aspergillus terreus NIH2624]
MAPVLSDFLLTPPSTIPAVSSVVITSPSTPRTPGLRRKRRPDSGEDAFFVSRIGHQNNPGAVAFAVADGVGGWAESRVDPADFSHALCSYMAQSALDWDAPAEQLRPKQILQSGYDQVVADESIRAGGSTASVGRSPWTTAASSWPNLGRLRVSAPASRPRCYHYSGPADPWLATRPTSSALSHPRMRTQASIFGGAFLEDFPRDAAVTNLQLQHGDVLMLATDGVFDNLNNQDILKLVTSRMVLTGAWTATLDLGIKPSANLDQLTAPDDKPASDPNQISTLQALLAATIAGEAKLASMDLRRDGPFAKEAQRYYPGDYYRGGKVDDICVLILIAVEEGYGASS